MNAMEPNLERPCNNEHYSLRWEECEFEAE